MGWLRNESEAKSTIYSQKVKKKAFPPAPEQRGTFRIPSSFVQLYLLERFRLCASALLCVVLTSLDSVKQRDRVTLSPQAMS